MKIYSFVLVFFLASPHFLSQVPEIHVTGRYDGTSIAYVLDDWKSRYPVHFAYDHSALDTILVHAEFVEAPLIQALEQILGPHGYQWKEIRQTLVIVPAGQVNTELPRRTGFTWSGVVRDGATTERLPFATVRVEGTTLGARADDDGNFTLFGVPGDTCTVIISYVGYHELRLRLTPERVDSDLPIELFLQHGIMPVAIIYGESPQLMLSSEEISTQQISIQDLSHISSPGQPDVAQAARLLPGIDATGETGSGLIIRGSQADQTRVVVDGMPIYHLDHFFGIFSAINPQAVKSLRVMKGGLDARYGGMTGGVVEMNGRDGNLRDPSAQVELGLLSVSAVAEVPVGDTEKSSVFVAARRSLTDWWPGNTYKSMFNTVYNAAVATPGSQSTDVFVPGQEPQFRFYDLNARISLRPSAKEKFTLSAYSGRDHLAIQYETILQPSAVTLRYDDRSEWGNQGVAFQWKHTWNASHRSEAEVSYTQYTSNLESINTVSWPSDLQNDLITRSTNENELRDLSLTLSHVLHQPQADSRFGFFSTAYDARESTLLLDSLVGNNRKAVLAGIFVQREWRPGRWRILPGIRLVHYSVSGSTYTEPRAQVTHRFGKHWLAKASAGRYHQFLHRVRDQSLYLDQGDAWQLSAGDLPVLRSDQLVLGMSWETTNMGIDAEAYLKYQKGVTENVRLFQADAGSAELVTGDGRIAGVDILVRREMLSHHVALGYTLLYTANSFPALQATDIPESFDQRHEVKVIYQWKPEHWTITCAFYLGSGKPYTPLLGTYQMPLLGGGERLTAVYGAIHSARLPMYHRLDLSASYLFALGKAHGELVASVFNAYNQKNLSDIRYFALGLASDPTSYIIGRRDIEMLGFLPSITLKLSL